MRTQTALLSHGASRPRTTFPNRLPFLPRFRLRFASARRGAESRSVSQLRQERNLCRKADPQKSQAPSRRNMPLLTELEFISIAQLQRCRPAGAAESLRWFWSAGLSWRAAASRRRRPATARAERAFPNFLRRPVGCGCCDSQSRARFEVAIHRAQSFRQNLQDGAGLFRQLIPPILSLFSHWAYWATCFAGGILTVFPD